VQPRAVLGGGPISPQGFNFSLLFQQQFPADDLRLDGLADKIAGRDITGFGDPLEPVPPLGRQQEREVDRVVTRHGCSFSVFKYVEVYIDIAFYGGVTGR